MLSPVRTYDAAADLGHSLYTVHVVFFATIPGVLLAEDCNWNVFRLVGAAISF